jgi:hypothetical protein
VFALTTPREALVIIENDHVETLRQCPTVNDRHEKIKNLFPESVLWSPIGLGWLIYQLHVNRSLNFGVCQFYSFDGQKYEQYCLISGKKDTCLCAVPQENCIVRDFYKDNLESSPTNA